MTVEATASPLAQAKYRDLMERMCRESPHVWAEQRRGFTNSALHREWYRLAQVEDRLTVLAPRDHAKTEVFTINMNAWRVCYSPGMEIVCFGNVDDQAKILKSRITAAVKEVRPDLVAGATKDDENEIRFANGAWLRTAGARKAVRGGHPDVIVGDDVLEESTTLTDYQRKKTARWWFGTVSGMAHGGDSPRTLPDGRKVRYPATKIHLVGTPFHDADLLMGMKKNEIYSYRRYSAEFDPARLPDPRSLAVEIA